LAFNHSVGEGGSRSPLGLGAKWGSSTGTETREGGAELVRAKQWRVLGAMHPWAGQLSWES